MALNIEDIRTLYENYGTVRYSANAESVTQLEHALQTATLAEHEDAPETLVAAAFLHDVGHLLRLHEKTSDSPQAHQDDLHQFFALPFLRASLPDAVLEPIKLHVDAKRCLCAIDPAYHGKLSPASVRSLQLQGGTHSAAEAEEFQRRPFANAALELRRWDDNAKVPGVVTPGLEHFLAVVASVQQNAG